MRKPQTYLSQVQKSFKMQLEKILRFQNLMKNFPFLKPGGGFGFSGLGQILSSASRSTLCLSSRRIPFPVNIQWHPFLLWHLQAMGRVILPKILAPLVHWILQVIRPFFAETAHMESKPGRDWISFMAQVSHEGIGIDHLPLRHTAPSKRPLVK